MALLHFDGFDTWPYAEAGARGYSASGAMGTGRFSTPGYAFSTNPNHLTRAGFNANPMIVGFAWRQGTTAIANLLRFFQGATEHVRIAYSGSNLAVSRAGTLLDVGSHVFAANVWNYVEVKAYVHDTLGYVEMRVNGIVDVLVENVDTRNAGTQGITEIRFGPQGGSTTGADRGSMDDLYVLDDTGPAPWNDFLGDCRVQVLRPNGAGDKAEFTPLAGTNWQAVDETTVGGDGDTTYVAGNTPGMTDLYALGDLAGGRDIAAVQVHTRMRKDDAGSRVARRVFKIDGTEYEGADFAPGDSYAPRWEQVVLNPATGLQWTVAELNALQLGVKVQT